MPRTTPPDIKDERREARFEYLKLKEVDKLNRILTEAKHNAARNRDATRAEYVKNSRAAAASEGKGR